MISDHHEILKDSKGFYYLYINKKEHKTKIRLKLTNCKKCGKKMYQHIMKKNKAEQYCSFKCKPYNKIGLELGRAWNKGKKNYLSKNTIAKMSRSHIGKRSGNWKGSKRGELNRIRGLLEYSIWRISVFERDKYICQECGYKKGRNLNAHHIRSFKDFPELRFDVNNGITLCMICHHNRHKKKVA